MVENVVFNNTYYVAKHVWMRCHVQRNGHRKGLGTLSVTIQGSKFNKQLLSIMIFREGI